MALPTKCVLIFFVISIFHSEVFPQAESLTKEYREGESLIKKNPSKAFNILEATMKSSRNSKDWKLYIKSVNSLASFNLDNDKTRDTVFQWLKSAFPLLASPKEDEDLAQLHFYTAEFYNRVTVEIDSPIFHYQQAKRIWNSLKGEWSAEVSHCYHGLGNIYKYYKFDFYEAEKCYEKALLIREKVGFNDPDVMYKNYYSLAATNRSQFDFQKAISYGDKTLEVAERLGPNRVELACGMVANIYRDMGESELAKRYYLRALAVNEKTENLQLKAWYYLCLGETLMKDSLFNDALQYFGKSYTLYSKPGVKNQNLFIKLLISMMESYSLINDQKKFDDVRKEIFQELNLLNKTPNSREVAEVWLLMGMHHDRQ
jgi:tetratricopeptide (TPR) repeat protein